MAREFFRSQVGEFFASRTKTKKFPRHVFWQVNREKNGV
ncbi:DUF1661 domain-containing protein [Porphyromonas gulae]